MDRPARRAHPDHGITAFLIGGADTDTTERFAAEVAPAVRDLVERERS